MVLVYVYGGDVYLYMRTDAQLLIVQEFPLERVGPQGLHRRPQPLLLLPACTWIGMMVDGGIIMTGATAEASMAVDDARWQRDGRQRQRVGALVDLLELPEVALRLPDAQAHGAGHLIIYTPRGLARDDLATW